MRKKKSNLKRNSIFIIGIIIALLIGYFIGVDNNQPNENLREDTCSLETTLQVTSALNRISDNVYDINNYFCNTGDSERCGGSSITFIREDLLYIRDKTSQSPGD